MGFWVKILDMPLDISSSRNNWRFGTEWLWYLIHRKDRITGLPRKTINTLLDIFEAIFQKKYKSLSVTFPLHILAFLSILILQSLGPGIGIQMSFPDTVIAIPLSSPEIVLIYIRTGSDWLEEGQSKMKKTSMNKIWWKKVNAVNILISDLCLNVNLLYPS